MDLSFSGRIIEWRAPAPFYYFVPPPEPECADSREVAAIATYGWGVITVEARIGEVTFETSLFPTTVATCCRSRTPYDDRSGSVRATTWSWR